MKQEFYYKEIFLDGTTEDIDVMNEINNELRESYGKYKILSMDTYLLDPKFRNSISRDEFATLCVSMVIEYREDD